MDLTSIEATSVAIRTGQVAAAELCNLLTNEEALRPIEDWFDPRPWPNEADLVQQRIHELAVVVDRLGGYVCHAAEPVPGERLYRWAVHEGLIIRGEWGDQEPPRCQSFEIFAATVRACYVPLKALQDRLEAAGAEPPKQISLALEDSIFEPEESFGALRPEAVAAAPAIEKMARQRIRDDARQAAKTGAEAAKAAADKPAPVSIGEAAPKPPVNRGGRGNTKSG